MTNSKLPRFYKRTMQERRDLVTEQSGLSEAQLGALYDEINLTPALAEKMVENVVGTFALPIGIGAYFQVNGQDRLVPMVIEEASVVAAASHAAKLLRAGGGLQATSTPPLMIGQIQLMDVPQPQHAKQTLLAAKEEILAEAAKHTQNLCKRGGGPQDLEVRILPPLEKDDPLGTMVVVHLLLDVRDAMGANAVNTVCEAITPLVEEHSQGRARLRILSNLTDRRLVTVEGKIPVEAFCNKGQPRAYGIATAKGIQEASIFAERDPYRAATHNKGIMNGIDAVLLATGQDFRAIEAGAHAYAARNGRYTALSRWRLKDDALHGTMRLPMAVGIVGGITRVHPTVQAALSLMKLQHAHELAEIAAAVGLAQNVAALRALAMEGIQRGHMRMHARNLAIEVGAQDHEIQQVADQMAAEQNVHRDNARTILQQIRARKP